MTDASDANRSHRQLMLGFNELSGGSAAELDAALLVAEVIDEQMDRARVQEHIQSLLAAAKSRGVMDLEGLLAFLRGQGFAQSSLEGVDLTHSSIDWLLQQRQGLPIVVAVLLITLAKALGLEAHGVNYPGHFLLRVQGDLVDPLALAVIDPNSLQMPKGYSQDQVLMKATPATLGFRMLNNLKAYYLRLGNWQATLAATDFQLAIVHEENELKSLVHFERGNYQQQMGDADAALASFLLCVETGEDPDVVARAQERISELTPQQDQPLH